MSRWRGEHSLRPHSNNMPCDSRQNLPTSDSRVLSRRRGLSSSKRIAKPFCHKAFVDKLADGTYLGAGNGCLTNEACGLMKETGSTAVWTLLPANCCSRDVLEGEGVG